ncbi:hypothetical protein [Methylobacterium pseudosasicola]|nr:hypothetical protein [Methylobacterium pseudosasicola]
MRHIDDAGPILGEMLRAQASRNRRTVALSRADVEGPPDVTVAELLRLPLRTAEDQAAFMERFGAKMVSEVVDRGDRRIEDPRAVADEFTASVREALRQPGQAGVHPIRWLLGRMGLRRDEIVPDARLRDLLRISHHRHRALIAADGVGIDPCAVVERVHTDRMPSAVIGDALERFGQEPLRRKGSSLNDVHLVCLSPYARMTSVDKGTFGNVARASARCSDFRSVVGPVARRPTYADLLQDLAVG